MNKAIGIIAAIMFVVLAGCSSGGEEGPFKPQVGSKFNYESWATDSNGQDIPQSHETNTATVKASGVTYEGKTNVYQYEWADGDDMYMFYETNGDVGFYIDADIAQSQSPIPLPIDYQVGWVNLPYGSKGSTLLPELDTTITVMNFNANILVTGNVSYIGEEEMMVNDEMLVVRDALMSVRVTASVPLIGSLRIDVLDTIGFAPGIGFLARRSGTTEISNALPFPLPTGTVGSATVLTGYALE